MRAVLPVILAGGFLYRLLFLGRRQLWTDEIMQAMILRSPSPAAMLAQLRDGMALPAPLDYFVQKGVVFFLGESAWTLRLHAAFLGALSIWLFCRIARRLFGARVAVYSTVLFALYPLHYHYSQEGRPYALFVFLTLFSYDLLLAIVFERGAERWRWLLIGLVLTLTLYSSLLGLLVLVSQFAALLFSARKPQRPEAPGRKPSENGEAPEIPPAQWRQLALYMLTAAVACVVFIPWVRFAFQRPLVAGPSEVADARLLLRMIKELGDGSYPMGALLLLGAGTGHRALRKHGRKRSLLWLWTWLAISIPAVMLLEIWSGYFFAIRHVLHTTPALVLLAGYGVSHLGERLSVLDRLPYRTSAPAILYAFLTLVMSVWIAQSHWRREPADWVGAARFLQENLRAGDAMAAPQVHLMLEFFAPSLSDYRVQDREPGTGVLASGEYNRRYVVCFNPLVPDPCSGFRQAASQDPAWRRQELQGFTIFIRER